MVQTTDHDCAAYVSVYQHLCSALYKLTLSHQAKSLCSLSDLGQTFLAGEARNFFFLNLDRNPLSAALINLPDNGD